MKKIILMLFILIATCVTANALEAYCSSSDGVSYVTVTTDNNVSGGGTKFILKGYGNYTNATAFVKFKSGGGDYTYTVDIRDGKGEYTTGISVLKMSDLKVEVADFCK